MGPTLYRLASLLWLLACVVQPVLGVNLSCPSEHEGKVLTCAAQVAAWQQNDADDHDPVTVSDTATIALSQSGQQISADVLAVPQSAVTDHEAALTITEAQISDLGSYLTAETDPTVAGAISAHATDADAHQALVTLGGVLDYLTISGQEIKLEAIDLRTDVTGNLPYASLSGAPTTWAWSSIISTPTTLSGYGITDAATSAQGALADSATQPDDLAAVATSGAAAAVSVVATPANYIAASGQVEAHLEGIDAALARTDTSWSDDFADGTTDAWDLTTVWGAGQISVVDMGPPQGFALRANVAAKTGDVPGKSYVTHEIDNVYAGDRITVTMSVYVPSWPAAAGDFYLLDFECRDCGLEDPPGLRLRLNSVGYMEFDLSKLGIVSTYGPTVASELPRDQWVELRVELELGGSETGRTRLWIDGTPAIDEVGENLPQLAIAELIDVELTAERYTYVQFGGTANGRATPVTVDFDDAVFEFSRSRETVHANALDPHPAYLDAGDVADLVSAQPFNAVSEIDNALYVSQFTPASFVNVAATPSSYTAGSDNVEAHLAGIDSAIGGLAAATYAEWIEIEVDVSAGASRPFNIPYSGTLLAAQLACVDAPTVTALVVDVRRAADWSGTPATVLASDMSLSALSHEVAGTVSSGTLTANDLGAVVTETVDSGGTAANCFVTLAIERTP